jgi:hypothetical protein
MENEQIEQLYRSRYDFKQFYPITSILISQNEVLLPINNEKIELSKEEIQCKYGDKRVDLPISFGSINAKFRLAVLGLEPRDSNPKYNIERCDNFVYGTPFGIEGWTFKNKYYKSFKEVLKRNDCYIYFTDVVKEYEVKKTKEEADKNARKTFWCKAAENENMVFLKAEFKLINPTHIVALGSQTYDFLHKHFGDKVIKVTHPNARQDKSSKENAWDAVNRQIQSIFENNSDKINIE